MVPELGPVRIKSLIDTLGSASAVFAARKKELSIIEGIGEMAAKQLKGWNDWKEAENEWLFTEQHQIRCLFLTDEDYPGRLLNCFDPPSLLYYRGNANLNAAKIISIIGTRNHTEYGKQVTEQLVKQLLPYEVMVISGLAYGIDAIAHKAAISGGLPTVGVLAHGLDRVYPPQHKSLAKEMVTRGGLLSEYRINNLPDKHHFPKRNRIVAGMCDGTIVIETDVKGGSMITASLAYGYNRDLFAIPGKLTDTRSSGCLKLIQQNKAILLTDGEQLAEIMGWQEKKKINKKQLQLFNELTEAEKKLFDLLKAEGPLPVDTLYLKSSLSSSSMAAAILNLELQNIICVLPGKMYDLV